MHFHLPKPLHGWREFAGEVGIIVIGVLIALSAEQVVEVMHWRREVADSRDALGYEIADSVGQGYEREHIYDCVEHRLDFLAATVDHAASTRELPPFSSPSAPPYRTWVDATWQTTMTGETATHFQRRELNIYGDIYVFVQNLQQLAPREMSVWSHLDAIAGPGRALEPGEAIALRNDISEARLLNRLITLASVRLRQAADSAKIHYDPKLVRDYAIQPNSKFSICTAMSDTPPKNYGSAPLDGVFDRLRNIPMIMAH